MGIVFRVTIMGIIWRIIPLLITVRLRVDVFIHLITGVKTTIVSVEIALRWLLVIRIMIIIIIWVIMDVRICMGWWIGRRRVCLGLVVFLVSRPLAWNLRRL
jgi:hypothetical protein